MQRSLPVLCLLMGAGSLCAQDGKVLYETYCGACHAPDGKGANTGQFPPLAGSAWVVGPASRMLQVVLHGLQGEVVVPNAGGKETVYNLAMPPQGAALTDQQIAAITTYVRSAWGNKGGAVTPGMVVKERQASAGRKTMWTADEILKLHPLPGSADKPDRIHGLISYVYHGSFKSLADLRKAKPVSVEEEQGGIISLKHAGNRKDDFGLAWEGEVVAPRSGDYRFRLDSDDGAAVFINGKSVVEVKGIGGMGRLQEGRVLLDKGRHKIRIEYFEARGVEGISLSWRGPKFGKEFFLSDQKAGQTQAKKKFPSIPLKPEPGKALIYRNFIQGTTARGIGVGYDRGQNLAFSADTMAMELIWKGGFLDGGRHWTNRGQGNTNPRGEAIKLSQGPAFAILPGGEGKWPSAYDEALKPRFKGYVLNKLKQPTFHYELGAIKVSDFAEPQGGEATPGLARRIELIAPPQGPGDVYFRVSTGHPLAPVCTRGFRIGGGLIVQIVSEGGAEPVVRGTDLLVPLQLRPGKNTLLVNYIFE